MSCGSYWQNCRLSQRQEAKSRHGLALRGNPKAGLCQTSPEFLRQSVAFALHRFFLRCVMRHGLLAGQPLVSYVVCVRHKDFTLRERNKDVELDAQMNPILSCTATNALSCITFSLGLETSCWSTTERPSFPRLDHPDFSTKPSTWNCSDGCHRCFRLRPKPPSPGYG